MSGYKDYKLRLFYRRLPSEDLYPMEGLVLRNREVKRLRKRDRNRLLRLISRVNLTTPPVIQWKVKDIPLMIETA